MPDVLARLQRPKEQDELLGQALSAPEFGDELGRRRRERVRHAVGHDHDTIGSRPTQLDDVPPRAFRTCYHPVCSLNRQACQRTQVQAIERPERARKSQEAEIMDGDDGRASCRQRNGEGHRMQQIEWRL